MAIKLHKAKPQVVPATSGSVAVFIDIDGVLKTKDEFGIRKCPECGVEYDYLHPVSDCSHGTVERIMKV